MTLETETPIGNSTQFEIQPSTDIHLLSCANCGTPLPPDRGKHDLACSYCGQRHRFLDTPADTTVRDFGTGDAVAVEWGGHWWSAHVVDVLKPGQQWKIHFEGWAPAFDDEVDISRIRAIDYEPGDSIVPPPFSAEPLEVRRSSPVPALIAIAALVGGVIIAAILTLTNPVNTNSGDAAAMDPRSPISGPISTHLVTDDTVIVVGQKLQVEWGDNWYMGTAMHVDTNGEIIIRYDGWGDMYDEVVPRSRLRLIE